MSNPSTIQILNQQIFDDYNAVEKSIFLSYRNSLLVTIDDSVLRNNQNEVLTFIENAAMEFVNNLDDKIRNIDELYVRVATLETTQSAQSTTNTTDDG